MRFEDNPYKSPESRIEVEDINNEPADLRENDWPTRLTVAFSLLLGFIFAGLHAVLLRQSTQITDRDINAYSALIPTVPLAVLSPALFVSTLRLSWANRKSRFAANLGLWLFFVFVVAGIAFW